MLQFKQEALDLYHRVARATLSDREICNVSSLESQGAIFKYLFRCGILAEPLSLIFCPVCSCSTVLCTRHDLSGSEGRLIPRRYTRRALLYLVVEDREKEREKKREGAFVGGVPSCQTGTAEDTLCLLRRIHNQGMSMSMTKVGNGSAATEPLLGGGDEQVMMAGPGMGNNGSRGHHHGCLMEESKAYEALRDAGLIISEFRRSGIDTLDIIPANSSKGGNLAARMCSYATGVGFCTYDATHLEFMVPAGHVQKICDGEGNYYFAGPGYHNIASMFWTRSGKPVPLRGHVKHGDRSILVVAQGHIGYATDNGQPMLLPPGIHEWRSDTMDFVKYIDLENHIIALGPYTLLTVDEGYAAVTQDNGKQVILGGGKVHLLNHRNWRFEKFMTLKVQTDELERIQATSADNILMEVTSTLNWRIVDVQTAAVMAAETMASSGRTSDVAADITKLRHDVLKQAIASLAAFIGSVNYSDSFHLAAAAQASQSTRTGVPVVDASGTGFEGGNGAQSLYEPPKRDSIDNPMFDMVRMNSAVETANKVTNMYGVEVISINIISANPKDEKLTRALASGAVASAEALQSETAARGNAKAQLIESEANAEAINIDAEAQARATIIRANAEAEAETIRAKAAKEAADMLASNQVAVDLAKMDKSGEFLGSNAKVILATEQSFMNNLLMRPDKF